MKHKGFTLIEISVLGCCLLILAVFLWPRPHRGEAPPLRKMPCGSHLEQIGQAMMQYMQDYNSHYPLHAFKNGAAYGWADALQPYLGKGDVLQCPSQKKQGQSNPRQRDYTDYWFNRNVSGVGAFQLSKPDKTNLCGDGNDGSDLTDARYALRRLPPTWFSPPYGPPFTRHFNGFNILFLDGSVRFYPGTRFGSDTYFKLNPLEKLLKKSHGKAGNL